MTEAELQAAVIELAQWNGWKVAHFRPAQNSRGDWRTPVAADGKGFPDLVMVSRFGVLVIELKAENGRLRPAQRAWLEAMDEAGVRNEVWRPSDWTSGKIERILKEGM